MSPTHICTEKETLGRMAVSLESIDKRLENMETTVFGDGPNGLKTEVTVLKEKQKNTDKWNGRWWGLFSALLTGLIIVGWKAFFG